MTTEPQIADLINILFQTRLDPQGNEYTNQQVADALGLDASYVGKLRKGKIPNPGRDTLKRLCIFFRVPASYFFPELQINQDPQSSEEQLRLLLRSVGLSHEAENYISGIIEILRNKSQGDDQK